MGEFMIELWHGDCIEKMGLIPDSCIDLVLTDPLIILHGVITLILWAELV